MCSVRSNAVLCLTLLLETHEGRERALATGMDAVLQDLRSRKDGHDDGAFTQDLEVREERQQHRRRAPVCI